MFLWFFMFVCSLMFASKRMPQTLHKSSFPEHFYLPPCPARSGVWLHTHLSSSPSNCRKVNEIHILECTSRHISSSCERWNIQLRTFLRYSRDQTLQVPPSNAGRLQSNCVGEGHEHRAPDGSGAGNERSGEQLLQHFLLQMNTFCSTACPLQGIHVRLS